MSVLANCLEHVHELSTVRVPVTTSSMAEVMTLLSPLAGQGGRPKFFELAVDLKWLVPLLAE